jgi:hypothetical protein
VNDGIVKVLNTAFNAMCDYNESDLDRYKYEYQNKWLRSEYPSGLNEKAWDDIEIENFEPTVTLVPMRKALRKAMVKLNSTLSKNTQLKMQMRSAAGDEKAKAKQADDEKMFDSTCMICFKKFEVRVHRNVIMAAWYYWTLYIIYIYE